MEAATYLKRSRITFRRFLEGLFDDIAQYCEGAVKTTAQL